MPASWPNASSHRVSVTADLRPGAIGASTGGFAEAFASSSRGAQFNAAFAVLGGRAERLHDCCGSSIFWTLRDTY
jgi:hypothetical protein